MKDQILKLAGVKSEAAFYKKFPTEEAFMKVHGKAFKKAAMGAKMVKDQLTQLTDFSNPPIAQMGITSPYDPSINLFGKTKPTLNTESPRALGDLTGATNFGMRNATDTSKMFGNFQSGQAVGKGLDKGAGKIAGKGAGAAGYLQAGMDVVEGISMIKGQNEAVKSAKQESLLTGVQADAAASQRRQPMKNYYTRPEDMMVQPEQLSPSYGVGTNILSAKNGTEIQNTYAPNDLYDDLGYEPLNDSDQVKAFYHGGRIPMAASGFSTSLNEGGFGEAMSQKGTQQALNNFSSMLINKGRGPSAGSKIGGGIGAAAGTFFGGPVGAAVGKFAGQAIGSLIDQSGRNIEKYNKQSDSNIAGMMGNYIPQQFGNVMEDGGWVSNDWQPQTITKFGEYDMKDLLQPPADADMLRAGGNLKSYTPPSERAMQTYAMGGELQVYRGEAEPISNNPYLPDGGETVMFRGPSHENGGMPISYGQSPVEVEGGEPAVKLRDGGGEDNLVVFGNLKINKDGAEMLGNPKLKNKKFKNYVNDLSKIEAKQNKLIDKSVDTLDNLDIKTPFDKLTMSAIEANLLGGNMKLKNIADKKQDAAALQSAINDTAEEYGVVADDLAQGKIKKAKLGTAIGKAQNGVYKTKGVNPGTIDYNPIDSMPDSDFTKDKYDSVWLPKVDTFVKSIKDDPEKVKEFIDRIKNYSGQDSEDVRAAINKGKNTEEQFKIATNLATDRKPGPYHQLINTIISNPREKLALPKPAEVVKPTVAKEEEVKPLKRSGLMDAFNQMVPFLRPSDAERLDPRQLMGEMYALSNNQLEPVQAQTYQPQLQTPYDISLQDQLNEVTAQTRQAERLAMNNPEALAAIYGQATMAKNQILGEQMRINQGQRAQTYASNIGALNEAQLMNLKAYDAQQGKQETAKSLTKATTQAALDSISAKYAQNKLSNRQLATMENLYNYRFDKSGRAINMNPLAQFNVDVDNVPEQSSLPEGYEYETILKKKKTSNTKESRNGSIVKAIKNL